MAKHLQRELERLKKDLLTIGAMVEEAIEKAMLAFDQQSVELAKEVIRDDELVNEKEVEVEESCLKILALHQPVAEDLRFVASVIRINNDLERMGDYAVSIAERTVDFMRAPIPVPDDVKQLEKLARAMVRSSLDAFVKGDSTLAREICKKDDEVDVLHRKLIEELQTRMREHPDQITSLLDIFTTVRRLERIADMATNIAQDVAYMVDGEIIRHRRN